MIEEILKAVKYEDLGKSRFSYKDLLKQVHPDLCKDPRAQEATDKLIKMHRFWMEGARYHDDSGEYICNNLWVDYKGNQSIIDQGRSNFEIVRNLSTDNMKKYIPYSWQNENKILHLNRALPLVGMQLAQKHVNWIISRLLEYCMLLHRNTNYTHLGLTPNNIFVVPETHGIAIAGFYHSAKIGSKIQTVSAEYKHWYPAQIFKEKIASEYVDLQMVKRIAACLLGDTSGNGTMLKRTHDKEYVDFILSSHSDSVECFKAYRAMMDKNYKPEFHILNI